MGDGSTLILNEISATLVLPGAHGDSSLNRTRIRVGANATLIWMPEPVIAVRGCDHVVDIRVELESTSRLVAREELLLGRHREPPGHISQQIQILRAGEELFHQQLDVGEPGGSYTSAAVIGKHLAIGSLLVVDPRWEQNVPVPSMSGDAACLTLAGPAVQVSVLTHDSIQLRRQLAGALTALVD